jgi:type IV pilus assembly protein PilM
MARNCSPIALDFGGHSVKAVQLDQRGGRLRVRCAHLERVTTAPDATPVERRDGRIEAAQRVLREGSFRGRSAVVALGLAEIETRRIRIPMDKVAQAGEIITREIQDQPGGDLRIVPIQVADLFDHGQTKREFLCCVAKASAIDDLVQVTEAVGLVPEAIDLEPCAQVRPFAQQSQDECFLHLDLGERHSRITIVRSGAPVWLRVSHTGGAALLATLRQRLPMDLEALLDLRQHPDAPQLGEMVTGALAEPLEALLLEIAAGVRYCGSLFQGRAVTRMRLSGGLAELPGLVPYLGRRIGITTELADPFGAIETGPVTTSAAGGRTHYCTALGLALRGLP